MNTRLNLLAVIAALAAFGPVCADEATVRDATGIEVIVVTAKRVAAPAEADIVASARRAVSEKKPEIALPQVGLRIERTPRNRG